MDEGDKNLDEYPTNDYCETMFPQLNEDLPQLPKNSDPIPLPSTDERVQQPGLTEKTLAYFALLYTGLMLPTFKFLSRCYRNTAVRVFMMSTFDVMVEMLLYMILGFCSVIINCLIHIETQLTKQTASQRSRKTDEKTEKVACRKGKRDVHPKTTPSQENF